MTNYTEHWETKYNKSNDQNWSETQTPAIAEWINDLSLPADEPIVCGGVGDANIVSHLLSSGYTDIIANDISQTALDQLHAKLKASHAPDLTSVRFVQDDLVNSNHLNKLNGTVQLYTDRATLHFFTEEVEQDAYFSLLDQIIKPGGYVIIGVFAEGNRPRCCGLDLQLWSLDRLTERLLNFDIRDSFTQAFEEKNGNIRNYLYIKAQKRAI